MLDVVNNLNDVMHASFIVGCHDLKSFGRLLKRDQLQMSKLKRNIKSNSSSAMNVVNRLKLSETNKCVEIFLFEKAIVICKRKTDDPSIHVNTQPNTQSNLQSSSSNTLNSNSSNSSTPTSTTSTTLPNQISLPSNSSSLSSSSSTSSTSALTSLFNFQYFYQFKELLKTNEIGLTENLKNDKKKFEIWSDTSSYIFEASTELDKKAWIVQIKILLENQLNEIKCKSHFG